MNKCITLTSCVIMLYKTVELNFSQKFVVMADFDRKANMTVILKHKGLTHRTILFPSNSIKLYFCSINVTTKNSFIHSSSGRVISSK